jgi:hypothetical protein
MVAFLAILRVTAGCDEAMPTPEAEEAITVTANADEPLVLTRDQIADWLEEGARSTAGSRPAGFSAPTSGDGSTNPARSLTC